MKISKNNLWLLILMITSQIMLTGLLFQWLRSQWKDEKELLQKDINQKFVESVNQVMDSMLVRHLLIPGLKDSTFKQVEDNTMITVMLPDSANSGDSKATVFSSFDSNEKNILLRSVKLIIKQTFDSTGEKNHLVHRISIIPDTVLLKRLFNKKLGNPKKFNVLWISDSAKNSAAIKTPVMYFKTNVFRKPLHVEIVHFQAIILKKISSQILFAIVLLTFTAAAFFFTYRSMRKQKMLNILRDDFISNISHELKTPVSTVSVALESLKSFDRTKEPERSNEYIDIAFNEMKRLDHLISQVLTTSVLEERGGYLRLEKTDLISLTREVLSSMQARFDAARAKVELITNSEEIILAADRLHVQGVLLNLIDNSLKYSNQQAEIKIIIEEDPGSVTMRIIDNGTGIPKEYISRVFEKFFRVPKGDIHDIKGYGLGLSYADLVMRYHGGTIDVRNRKEGGCEFTVLFPKKKK